jgi:anti-anti-sigma regulatory factor
MTASPIADRWPGRPTQYADSATTHGRSQRFNSFRLIRSISQHDQEATMLASDQPLTVRARTDCDTAGVLHVDVAGDIDMASAPLLRDTLSSLVARHHAPRRPTMDGHLVPISVRLDLSAVTFLSRAGFDALLIFGLSLTGELTLTGLSRPVRRLLHALPTARTAEATLPTLTAADMPQHTRTRNAERATQSQK